MNKRTDFERNKRLAKLVYPDAKFIEPYTPKSDAIYICISKENVHNRNHKIDYCNNPSDLMPLVWKYQISGIFTKGLYSAYRYISDADDNTPTTQANNKNPQIALVDCLLLVLGNKDTDK